MTEELLLRSQRREYRDWLRTVDPRCFYCGRHLKPNATTLDHIVPVSRGGTHHPQNLALACPLCNAAKRERTLLEWLQDLQQAWLRLTTGQVISPEIKTNQPPISPEINIPPETKDA